MLEQMKLMETVLTKLIENVGELFIIMRRENPILYLIEDVKLIKIINNLY